MTEREFIQRIRGLRSGETPDFIHAFRIALEGLESYPYSARLLCDAGDLLQLTDDEQFGLKTPWASMNVRLPRTPASRRRLRVSATITMYTRMTSTRLRQPFARHSPSKIGNIQS